MIEYIKSLFRPMEASVLAVSELEDAKRKLLEAQTNLEYAQALVAFRQAQIKRLTNYIGEPK